jgi:hypothetical protein
MEVKYYFDPFTEDTIIEQGLVQSYTNAVYKINDKYIPEDCVFDNIEEAIQALNDYNEWERAGLEQ